MPITNNDAIKYLIKQVVSNDGAGNVTLQPIWPQTVGTQILSETSARLLGQNSIVLGSTYTDGVLNTGSAGTGYTTTINAASLTGNIVLTLPDSTGTLATIDDVNAVVVSVSDGVFDLDNTGGTITVSPYGSGTADLTWVGTAGNAGKFYLGTVAPSGTTRLNYNGNLYATKLYSGGNEVLTAVSDAGLATGEAITEITISNNEIVVTRDSFLHLGTSGSNIAQTVYGTKTFNSTISGSIDGNAATVTNGVYTVGDQTIGGIKTFSSEIQGNISGQAGGADTVLTASSATDGSHYLTFVDSNNGTAANESLYTDSGISYNPNTDLLTLAGDIAVNGGDITTTSSTLNIGNTAATTHTTNLDGAATQSGATKSINIGAGGLSGSTTNVVIGSSNAGSNNTVTIKGNLIVDGTTTTENVETVSTSNGVLFEGTVADEFELLLKAGGLTADQTVTLPDATGTVALTSDIKDSQITIAGGTDLEINTSGGANGIFTLNQSSNETITLDHSSVSRTDTTSTGSPAAGGTFTVVDSVTSSGTGHITAINVKTITLPDGDTYDISASSVTGGASLDLDASTGTDTAVKFLGSGTTTVTRTDSSTITISSADQYVGTVTSVAAGDGMNFTTITSSGSVTLGTPSTLSSTSTNAVTTSSHTHAITSGSLTNNSQGTITVGGTGKVLDANITVELAANYGDTVNPYASKTANYVLAAPNGSNGAPSFRALANADLPNSGVTAGTYTAATVNAKGVVTAGFQSIQFGTYTTAQGPTNSTNQPAANLIAGGIFFEALEASDA